SAKSALMMRDNGSKFSAFLISAMASVFLPTKAKCHAYQWWADAYAGLRIMARRNSFSADSKSQSKPSKQNASELWASPSALSNSRALVAAALAFGSASLGVITAYCQSPNKE